MSVCADALEELMALGVSGPALVAAVRRLEQAAYGDRIADLEAAVKAAADKADAELEHRRSKDRERKRESRVRGIPVTSTESADTKDVSPTPPSENPSLPKGPLKGPQKVSAPSPSTLEKPKPKPIGAWTSEIWEITPRPGRTRSGKALLETALKAAIRKAHDPGRVKAGVAAYYDSPDATKNEGQFAQGVHVVINSGRWEAFAEDADRPPDDDPDPWRPRLLNWRMNRYWNSEWGPKPGEGGYRGPAEPEARAA